MTDEALSYGPMVCQMRAAFNTGKTKTKQWRESQLKAAIECLTNESQRLIEALNKDLNKDAYDSMTDEISYCINEADWFINNLDQLMSIKKQTVDMLNLGGIAYVRCEPVGVVLDITPWNYPVQLPISTMLNVISAGNCIVIKLSELAQHTAELLAEIFPKYFDQECIRIVNGAVPETTALLKERWDHIIYTGSGPVGKIVYKAAAQHLTPCTMELGGKCPSFVSAGSDLEAVCNRICWAKFKNAGQTCISVDYVLVEASIKQEFLKSMVKAVEEQYTGDPAQCEGYGRIINDRHFQRVTALLDASPDKVVHVGGENDASTRYIAPTVVSNISPDDKLMQEEIFGPILPVLEVKDHNEAITFINFREKPLHLNVFSKDQSLIDEFIHRTSSGGFSSNDVMVFKVEKGLPFGGVGDSGFGAYSGDAGFENFSHKKAVLLKSQGIEWLFKLMRYSPHTPAKMNRFRLIQEFPKKLSKLFTSFAFIIAMGLVIGAGLYFGFSRDGTAQSEL